MKKKIIIGGVAAVLLILLFFGYRLAYVKVNTLFPLDENEVLDVFVEEDVSKPLSVLLLADSLRGEQAAAIIEALNQLELVKEERELVRYSLELGEANVLYEVHIIFDHTKNKLRYHLRREGGCTLYILENNRIIVFYGGYEYYDVIRENYDDFLTLLDEYKNYCLTRIELEDGPIFTNYEDYHNYLNQEFSE